MKPRFYIFITLAVLCLLAAFLLAANQLSRYQASLTRFPAGSTIAGVAVGGLDAQAAGTRLAQAYLHSPLELRYGGSPIHIDPQAAGLSLDIGQMLSDAQEGIASTPFWDGFRAFLFNRPAGPVQVELACSVDSNRLHALLEEMILPRYGTPAVPAQPFPGTVNFAPGQPGFVPNLEQAIEPIRQGLCSLASRSIALDSIQQPAPPATLDQLRLSIESLVQTSGYNGVIELYYQDLESGQEFQVAYNRGRPIEPGVAFTAASTIKIPVMVSVYRQVEGDLPESLRQKMAEMIDLSDNASTDAVMQSALDTNLAPIQVTEDARALGMDNTFLGGFFFTGAPLLDRFLTPANQRGDLSTDPDLYNQTTAEDMGHLLAGIQRCAANGNGPLIDTFAGQVTPKECQEMVDLLAKNRKGVLIEAGLPEGTRMAHKYGWVTDFEDGLMHTASDAAIVFTPRGDFVLTVYLYDPDQLQWDSAQALVARLGTVSYNYYNQVSE